MFRKLHYIQSDYIFYIFMLYTIRKKLLPLDTEYRGLWTSKTNRYLQTNTIFVFTYSRDLEYSEQDCISKKISRA